MVHYWQMPKSNHQMQLLPNKPLTFSSLPNRLLPQVSKHLKTLAPALVMVTKSGSSKRPICPSCSKPTRTCLCTRFKTSKIDNSVAITILQHSLEKNHPLNTTRIAALGLNNVQIIPVSDVNFQANFSILYPNPQMGSAYIGERNDICEKYSNPIGENYFSDGLLESSGSCTLKVEEYDKNGELFLEGTTSRSSEEATIDFTIQKYGVISSFRHGWMQKGQPEKATFEKFMDCKDTVDNLAGGFVVKKLQKKQIYGSFLDEESEIVIPEGSVLLFPSEKAVGFGDLQCEVKNLIVLDGTWAKARRMYSENPWLKVLPHLKLDVDKMSLYSEVRQQPKAGYLSTIESIVYSLKAVGNDCEGLDGLLDVFQSMVGDQRRFKDDRLNEESA